ncbi:MAG: hypothetical protein QWI36_01565 [Wolbachia endosymbiont of Tyrophagus putrescentiae]|nr:hypothetical protein [Wolbachia endosymbiont of Tyrophagus putrescentiae]
MATLKNISYSGVKSGLELKNYKEPIQIEQVSVESIVLQLYNAIICDDMDIDVLLSGININWLDEKGNSLLIDLLHKIIESKREYNKRNLIKVLEFLANHVDLEEKHNVPTVKLINKLTNELKNEEKISEIKIKKELGVSNIEEVSLNDSCAEIKLNPGEKELKISEFLQGSFCKDNNVSRVILQDDKSKIVVFVSDEGVRHYIVARGSYKMTLEWPVGNEKHSIEIHVSEDGTIEVDNEYLEKYQAGQINVSANHSVKIGGLSLAEALSKGKWTDLEKDHSFETNQSDINKNSVEALSKNEDAGLEWDDIDLDIGGSNANGCAESEWDHSFDTEYMMNSSDDEDDFLLQLFDESNDDIQNDDIQFDLAEEEEEEYISAGILTECGVECAIKKGYYTLCYPTEEEGEEDIPAEILTECDVKPAIKNGHYTLCCSN